MLMRLPVKKILGKIHLWLGLTAGLVVFISLTAAAVFVWEKNWRNGITGINYSCRK